MWDNTADNHINSGCSLLQIPQRPSNWSSALLPLFFVDDNSFDITSSAAPASNIVWPAPVSAAHLSGGSPHPSLPIMLCLDGGSTSGGYQELSSNKRLVKKKPLTALRSFFTRDETLPPWGRRPPLFWLVRASFWLVILLTSGLFHPAACQSPAKVEPLSDKLPFFSLRLFLFLSFHFFSLSFLAFLFLLKRPDSVLVKFSSSVMLHGLCLVPKLHLIRVKRYEDNYINRKSGVFSFFLFVFLCVFFNFPSCWCR